MFTGYPFQVTGIFFLIIAKQFYCLKTKATILFFFTFSFFSSIAQTTQFSLATDVTVIRSFKKEQRFWTIGQTIAGHFHFTPRDGMSVFFDYSGNGKFNNQLAASAKDSATVPQEVDYSNKASMQYNHMSIGWKHYLKGLFNAESKWNLYGYAGFGLMFGQVENTQTVSVDTAKYSTPVLNGKGHFKRLTLDVALGFEIPTGGDIFFYMEARALIPTTDYPSNYLLINKDAPLIGSVNAGMRILFD